MSVGAREGSHLAVGIGELTSVVELDNDLRAIAMSDVRQWAATRGGTLSVQSNTTPSVLPVTGSCEHHHRAVKHTRFGTTLLLPTRTLTHRGSYRAFFGER